MNPLLVSGFGTTINVEKRKLIIQNRLSGTKYEFYPHKITFDNVILDSHSGNISFDGIKWLMKHDIPLTILNWNGNILGITLPETPKHGTLRIKQYQKYLDSAIRHEIAEKMVMMKVNTSLNLLKELANFYEIDINEIQSIFQKEISFYYSSKGKQKTSFLNNLMTFEGRIAVVYFENISKIISKISPKFNFQSRRHDSNNWNMNAADEINALLNYGYAILESEIKKIVNSIGFDPGIGFLHEVAPSKTPLIYDFQELFRWIIDLSIIQLLEMRPKIKKTDFILTENYNIRLKPDTAQLLIDKIKYNFHSKAKFKNKKYTYSSILFENIQRLSNYIMERSLQLDFDVPNYTIERIDSVDLQNKILKMTPAERKKLGISKTTLWYMKENLKSGSKIRIYKKILDKLESEK